MGKDRKGLQILDGFRHSFLDSPGTRVNGHPRPRQEEGSTYSHFLEPRKDDLVSALTAMEHRVNGLLEDRRRIGRDLHDSVLQSLYAIGLNLEASRNTSFHHPPESTRPPDLLVAQLNQLIQEVRVMIESLEADTIRDFDMVAELDALRTTYEQSGRLCVELDLQPRALDNLTNEEEREILNIVREALSNCARHADATRVIVAVRMRGTRIRVSIADDGRGFNLSDGCHRGYGLSNMETRARNLGGTMRVRSAIGQGTAITAEFSLAPLLAHI